MKPAASSSFFLRKSFQFVTELIPVPFFFLFICSCFFQARRTSRFLFSHFLCRFLSTWFSFPSQVLNPLSFRFHVLPSVWLAEVRNMKEMIEETRSKGRKVHFASLVDLCHLKNSELEPQYQKCKGRVVLRGDVMKDGSVSHAVFTEQGSSASKMTAVKAMDVLSRPPGCASPLPGQNGKCSIKGPNHGPVRKTQSFLLNGNCTAILWQDYHGKSNTRTTTVGKQFQIGYVYA